MLQQQKLQEKSTDIVLLFQKVVEGLILSPLKNLQTMYYRRKRKKK